MEPSAKYLARPGRKPTDVGLIPEDWTVRRVGEMGEVRAGKALAVRGAGQQRPYLRTKNVFDGRIDLEDVLQMPMTDSEFARYELRHGDVLLNEGQSLNLVGRCAMYKDELSEPCAIQNQLVRFRAYDGVSANFAAHLFRYCQKNGVFAKIALQTTSVAHLGVSRFQALPLALPPKRNEQEAIAEALNDADALIESLEQLLAKKRLIKQGAIQELLRLRGSDVVRPLGEISSLKGRIGWQGLKQTEFTTNEEDPFLITGMNFKDGAIRWGEVYHISDDRYAMAPEIQLRPNDVLMTKDGTIGKVLYIDHIPYPGKASLNSHLLLFRPIGASYHPKYLYYQLSSRRFKDFVEISKSGTTFFGLSQAAVATYPVLLPPFLEQQSIATTLSDMDSDIAAAEDKLTKARQIKQAMMQELLTGRIRLL